MNWEGTLPSTAHLEAAYAVVDYAARLKDVDTVLMVNSCARGIATPQSDLDMAILMKGSVDADHEEAAWQAHVRSDSELTAFCNRGTFSALHVDFFDGVFTPEIWDDGGGPDDFEIEIGNRVAFAKPFGETGTGFEALKARWLPFYDESLRVARLEMVRNGCLLDLDFVPFYVGRGLYLQAFDRLYKAFREYLQSLFIANRRYPIAYNKWLVEQLKELGKSELYEPLLSILSVSDLSTTELNIKAGLLRELESEI